MHIKGNPILSLKLWISCVNLHGLCNIDISCICIDLWIEILLLVPFRPWASTSVKEIFYTPEDQKAPQYPQPPGHARETEYEQRSRMWSLYTIKGIRTTLLQLSWGLPKPPNRHLLPDLIREEHSPMQTWGAFTHTHILTGVNRLLSDDLTSNLAK